MPMLRPFLIALPLAVVGACLGGCYRDPVLEVPGHLQPGDAIKVARQAIGGGSNQDSLTIGTQPVVSFTSPNVPIMVDGEVDILYGVPQTSLDGESLRGEHFLQIKVSEQSFALDWLKRQKKLLSSEDSAQIPRIDSVPRSARLASPRRAAPVVEAQDDIDLPFSQQTTTKVTVAEFDPNSGAVAPVGTTTVPNDVNAMSAAGNKQLQDVMQRYQEAAAARQRQGAAAQPQSSGAGASPRSAGK